MRCKSCDRLLKDWEATWIADIGQFNDMCGGCKRYAYTRPIADDRSDSEVICDSLDIVVPTTTEEN